MMNRLVIVVVCISVAANLFGQTEIKKVKPSDTDPLIATFNFDSNYVYLNPTVAARNVLVVYLPGSNSEPKHTEFFGILAADLGFHSIGLMYPNVPAVASMCTNSSDPSCHENVRREIIEGSNYSAQVEINSTECILNRTKKLLIYLNANYPSENWGHYLDVNNELIFSNIIFSGGSQGGGHAAVIGKYFPTKRIVCFSAPKDYSLYYNAPPLWYSNGTWQTAKSEIYTFNHTLDFYAEQLQILDSLGLDDFGSPINIDSNSSPYNFTRQLFTSYPVPAGDEHGCTVADNKTPKVLGVPVFLPVWTYMLTENLTTGVSDNFNEQDLPLILSPNPTNSSVYLELPNNHYVIKLYDQTGQLIREEQSMTGNVQIDLSTLNAGLYFIQAHCDQQFFTGKVMKQ